MVGTNKNKIVKYLRSIKTRRTSLRLQNKVKKPLPQNIAIKVAQNPLGVFSYVPDEILFYIFHRMRLYDLASLALTSRALRDKLMSFHYSTQALPVLKPVVINPESSDETDKESAYLSHFHNLGIFLKRLTCLYSTRERLRIVGILLEKLKDTHLAICEHYGSDVAYRCYGNMLHALIAGWENDEKCRAYLAVKGASRVDERLDEALKRGPGSKPWYEKYVRVFYREIFLDKADDGAELGFWLCQMLSPLPLVYQARMLYILYGPEDSNEELIYWYKMTTCPTFFGVNDKDLEGIAKALTNLYNNNEKEWSRDNLISVMEELIILPGGWCLENIAKLLKLCGDAICCEFLGSKAINGRTQELAFIAYYIVQALMEDKLNGDENKEKLEWFVSLMKRIVKVMPCKKQRTMLVSSLFDVWEETILGLHEDVHAVSDNDTELIEIYNASVHYLAKVSGMLLLDKID